MALGHCWECGWIYRDRETCPGCGHKLTPLGRVIVAASIVFAIAAVVIGLQIYLSH